MANDKKKTDAPKQETKPETAPAGGSAAPAAAAPARSTALVLAKAGISVPSADELQVYDQRVVEKLSALEVMLAEMPDTIQANVEMLIEQASPNKQGMEEMEQRGTDIPRIYICQPTSTKASKPEAAKNGDLYTDTGALLERPFSFIPIYFYEENVMFPKGSKAPECKAPDGKYGLPYGLCAQCAHLPFGKQNGGQGDQKPTDCFGQTIVVVLTMDLKHLYAIPFAKTSYSAGRALARLCKGQSVVWKQSYTLDTEKKTGEQGLYYVAKISPTGKDNSAETLKVGQSFSELIGAQRKKMIGEFYAAAANSQAQQAHAEKNFQSGSLDLGDDGGEPDVMPESGAGVRSGKPM